MGRAAGLADFERDMCSTRERPFVWGIRRHERARDAPRVSRENCAVRRVLRGGRWRRGRGVAAIVELFLKLQIQIERKDGHEQPGEEEQDVCDAQETAKKTAEGRHRAVFFPRARRE